MQMAAMIEAALRTSIKLTNRLKGVESASILDHEVVARAIAAGDEAGATAALGKIITDAAELFLTAGAQAWAER